MSPEPPEVVDKGAKDPTETATTLSAESLNAIATLVAEKLRSPNPLTSVSSGSPPPDGKYHTHTYTYTLTHTRLHTHTRT